MKTKKTKQTQLEYGKNYVYSNNLIYTYITEIQGQYLFLLSVKNNPKLEGEIEVSYIDEYEDYGLVMHQIAKDLNLKTDFLYYYPDREFIQDCCLVEANKDEIKEFKPMVKDKLKDLINR